jgi:hypothetical protein
MTLGTDYIGRKTNHMITTMATTPQWDLLSVCSDSLALGINMVVSIFKMC